MSSRARHLLPDEIGGPSFHGSCNELVDGCYEGCLIQKRSEVDRAATVEHLQDEDRNQLTAYCSLNPYRLSSLGAPSSCKQVRRTSEALEHGECHCPARVLALVSCVPCMHCQTSTCGALRLPVTISGAHKPSRLKTEVVMTAPRSTATM